MKMNPNARAGKSIGVESPLATIIHLSSHRLIDRTTLTLSSSPCPVSSYDARPHPGVVTPGTGTVSCCPAPNSFVPDQYLTPTKQRATGDPAISCASSPHSINTRSSLKRRGIILNSDSEQQHDATRKKLKFGRKELMKLNKEDRVTNEC